MEQSPSSQPPSLIPYGSPDTPRPIVHRTRLWTALGWKTHLLMCLGLFFITAATFSNSYKAGMTLDNRYIIEEYYRTILSREPQHEVASWKQVSYFFMYDYWWPKGISGLYRPITSLSYWLDYAILTGKAPKRNFDGSVPMLNGAPIADSTWETLSWAQYSFAPGQLNTFSYHTINLILHWTNAVLVYFISLSLLNRLWPAAFVAVLFAVHPITTESVTNIIGRADIFAAMCTFGGLLLYMRSLCVKGWSRAPWLGLIMLVLFIGFLAKESAVAVGAIIPLYWFTYHYSWDKLKIWIIIVVEFLVAMYAFNGYSTRVAALICILPIATWVVWVVLKRSREDWMPLARELLVWCVMLPPLLGMLGMRHWVFSNATPAEEPFLDNPIRGIWQVQNLNIPSFEEELRLKPMPGMSYLECKMTAVKILGKLMSLLAWPATLCCDYSFDQIPNFTWNFHYGMDDVEAIVALMVILGVLALAVWLLRIGQKAGFFYIMFFFLAALPTSNLVVTIGSVMAERFMYLPLMGFTGLLVIGVYSLGQWVWTRFKLMEKPDVPRYSIIAGEVLALIMVVYGIRAFARNPVWESDLTLWEDAIQTSPRSFRCYQSLAFALYERYMLGESKDLNRIIKLDLDAVPLTAKLPNHLNSSRLYLHLGMYLTKKGDLLTNTLPGGEIEITREARAHYQQAAELLEIGSKIDRAFNEVNRAKQLRRNDPEDQITDVGLAPIYAHLGAAYDRLGMSQEALQRYDYHRQLDPLDADAYQFMAAVQVRERRYESAAILLIEALLLDGKRTFLFEELKKIYAQLGHNGIDAVITDPMGQRLNVQTNAMVRDHLIQAYRDLLKMGRRTRRSAIAEDAWTTAVLKHGFERAHFDPLFDEPIPTVTPHGIIYPDRPVAGSGAPPATQSGL